MNVSETSPARATGRAQQSTRKPERRSSSGFAQLALLAGVVALSPLPAAAEIVIVGANAPTAGKVQLRPTPASYGQFTATNPAAYNPEVGNLFVFFGRVYTAADVIGGHGHVPGVHDYSSSIGFKGSTRIDDELAVVWQNDNTLSNYDGTGSLGSRETFIGLTSRTFGSLRIGRFQNPYDRHSMFGDMVADTQGLGITQVLWANCAPAPAFKGWTAANSCFDNKQANSIRYDSVDYGPLFGAIQFSSYSQGLNTANSVGGAHSVSAALTYRSFPFAASVGWEHHTGMTTINQLTTAAGVTTAKLNPGTSATGTAAGDDAFEVVGGYQVSPNVYVGGIYERLKYSTDKSGHSLSRNMFGLVGRYAVGGKWLFELTHQVASSGSGSAADGVCAGNVCAGSDTGATHTTLGARYNLAPQTAVYLQLVRLANDSNGIYSLKNYSVLTTGEKTNGLSLGFQHVF